MPKNKSDTEKLNRLMKWGKENGMDPSNIKVVYYSPDFRGVHANRRIRSGERIVTASRKVFVTLSKILESCPLAKKVVNCGAELGYKFATALACMVYETKNNPKSWWQPYAESFPETADNFPYFFSDTEKEFLKGTIWEHSMKSEIKESLNEYNAICERVPEFKTMTSDVYLKLTTLACSRYFSVEEMPDHRLAAPIIDMFNYYVDKSAQTRWRYFPSEDVFAVVALQNIPWGEIIGLNYGTKPNGRYLLYYGFIPENNDYMYISVSIELQSSDPLLKEKQSLLGYYKDERFLYTSEFYFDWNSNFEENSKAISMCRFAAYKGNTKRLTDCLEEYSMTDRYKKFTIPSLSIENEIGALEIFKKFAQSKINEYPNKLEKDKEILRTQKDLTENAKCALTVRIGELEAFTKMINFSDHMIKLLENPKDIDKEIKLADEWYKEYIKRVIRKLIK